MITFTSFVAAFPEFGSANLDQFSFWSAQAYQQLNATRFGQNLDLGAMLFVAHNLALAKREQRTAAFGGVPGQANGPLASKGVGPASASYDTGATAIEGSGDWNYTTYGQRLYRMMRAFGAGPVYRPGFRPLPRVGGYGRW